MMGATPAKLFEMIIEHLPNPFPDPPANGVIGWSKLKEPRACIDNIRFGSNIRSHRNDLIFRLGCELRRRDFSIEAAEKECNRVNQHSFASPMTSAEVNKTVRSAYKKMYAHKCNDDHLQKFCVGIEKCKWLKEAQGEWFPVESIEEDTFENNWYPVLRSVVREVYSHIRELEKKYRKRPGGTIRKSFRQIAQDMRLKDKGAVERSMKKLVSLDLIEIITHGVGGSPSGPRFVSEFRRVIPIPKPGEKNGNSKKRRIINTKRARRLSESQH